MTKSASVYAFLPLPDAYHEYLIAVVNLVIVALMLRYDTRGIGGLFSVFQVGNGAYAKWRNGMGVGMQILLAGMGVGIWWLRGKGF
jgi:hypothetical protein